MIFIGSVSFDNRQMLGILLDEWSLNGHDGTVDGTQYFEALEGRNLLVPFDSVVGLCDKLQKESERQSVSTKIFDGDKTVYPDLPKVGEEVNVGLLNNSKAKSILQQGSLAIHEYKYQHENVDDNENENKTRLESHHKVLQSSILLKMVMDGNENALKHLNMCNVEHCQMYLMDAIAAKYNLNQQRKAEVIADTLFCMISLSNWEVSVEMIEAILY
ncbi:hypothetical protein RFI_31406, partial [Reticulomyxa filosa]